MNFVLIKNCIRSTFAFPRYRLDCLSRGERRAKQQGVEVSIQRTDGSALKFCTSMSSGALADKPGRRRIWEG